MYPVNHFTRRTQLKINLLRLLEFNLVLDDFTFQLNLCLIDALIWFILKCIRYKKIDVTGSNPGRYVEIFIFCFSFKLYFVYSNVGRGNLVLRHSVPHFLPIFCDITRLRVVESELNATFWLVIRMKK